MFLNQVSKWQVINFCRVLVALWWNNVLTAVSLFKYGLMAPEWHLFRYLSPFKSTKWYFIKFIVKINKFGTKN